MHDGRDGRAGTDIAIPHTNIRLPTVRSHPTVKMLNDDADARIRAALTFSTRATEGRAKE
jgi:hypothetical protein